MIHFILLLVCLISIEVFIRLYFLSILDSILLATRKVIRLILQKNISDHWKEKAVPAYALRIMKYSLQILMVLLLIFSIFFIADFFFSGLFTLTLSLIGIIESILFVLGYAFIRKSLFK